LRTVVAVVLTLVAMWSAQMASASARSGLMELCADEPVSCCCGHDDDAPIHAEQRIEPVCGCTVEPAPQSNPPPAQACVAQPSIRVAAVVWVEQASIEPSRPAGPAGPGRAWLALDRLRASPLPGGPLVAQKIALLI
jgi:hypothetical protein